jgi:hypothetical protein
MLGERAPIAPVVHRQVDGASPRRPWSNASVPKDGDRYAFVFTKDEVRELRLAVALRIARLGKVDVDKMMPSDRARLRDQVKTSTRLHDQFRKASGK